MLSDTQEQTHYELINKTTLPSCKMMYTSICVVLDVINIWHISLYIDMCIVLY